MKTIYYKICKSITFFLSVVFPLVSFSEVVYVNSGDSADIQILGLLSDSNTTSHRIYENASSLTDYANVVDNSENDSAINLRFSSYGSEYTDEIYGDYVRTSDVLNYQGNMYTEALFGGDTGRRAFSYARSAGGLLNYSVASTTTQIIVTNTQDYVGGNITNDIQIAITNYINNVINNTITNFVDVIITNSIGGYVDFESGIVSNIYSVLVESLQPLDSWKPSLYSTISSGINGIRIDLDGLNTSLLNELQSINSKAFAIVTYLNYNLGLALTNIVNDVNDIYNLQEDMVDILDVMSGYEQSNNFYLGLLNDNLLEALGILSNIAVSSNSVDFAGSVSVTNQVSTDARDYLAKLAYYYSWLFVPNNDFIQNIDNITNDVLSTSRINQLKNNFSRQFSTPAKVADSLFQNGYHHDSITQDVVQDLSLDQIPRFLWGEQLSAFYLNFLNYYALGIWEEITNQFPRVNVNLSSISNDTQTIIGILTNLDFNVSNDFASIYADYTGTYNRVWHDIGDSLTNNASIFSNFRDGDPIEVYSNIVFNSENVSGYNWFERVEYLLWALVAGDGATNGWENTEEDTTRIYSISNEVESSMSGMLTSLKSRLDDVGATTNKVMQFFDNFKDIVTENARLEDVEIEWMPSSLASQQEVSTYLILPVTENEDLRSLCDFIRNIMIAVWFLVFAWLGSNLGERVLKLSWRIIVLGYSFFQKILGSK